MILSLETTNSKPNVNGSCGFYLESREPCTDNLMNVRLRQTQTTLCEQLEAMRTANQVREDELLNEISSMRALLERVPDKVRYSPFACR